MPDTYAYVDMGEAFDENGSTHFKVKIHLLKRRWLVESATASADVLPTPMTQAQVDTATSAASIGTFELTAPFVITGSKDPYSGALEDITTAFNFESMESVLPGGELLHFEVQECSVAALLSQSTVAAPHVEGTVFDDAITLEVGKDVTWVEVAPDPDKCSQSW